MRLPGQLREKLEREAQAKGKSLTAEILERLEDTFSTNPDRIEALEKVLFGENLEDRIATLEDQIESLRIDVAYAQRRY